MNAEIIYMSGYRETCLITGGEYSCKMTGLSMLSVQLLESLLDSVLKIKSLSNDE